MFAANALIVVNFGLAIECSNIELGQVINDA